MSFREPNPLAILGVDDERERLYRAVLSVTGGSLDDVAKSANVDRDGLEERLQPLVDRGLVMVEGTTVLTRLPADALTDVVLDQLRLVGEASRRIEEVRAALPSVRLGFRPAQSESEHPLDGEVRTGGDIPKMFSSWIQSSTGDLCWMRPDQWAMPHESELTRAVGRAIEAGRACRALYPVRALEEGGEALKSRARAGEQVRIAPEVPTRLAIFGSSAAVLQERFGLATNRRLLVREAGIIDAVTVLFEHYWAQGIDVPGLDDPARERRRVMRQLLLKQLASGAKDERIARNLGLSLRTVRRRVAELQEEYHVATRFQLGAEAVRRGEI